MNGSEGGDFKGITKGLLHGRQTFFVLSITKREELIVRRNASMSNGRAFSNGIKQRRFERNCRSGAVCLKEGIKAGQSVDVIEERNLGCIKTVTINESEHDV